MNDRQDQIKNEFIEMVVEIARHYDERLNQEWVEGYKEATVNAQQIIAGATSIDEARTRTTDKASIGFLIQDLDEVLRLLGEQE